MCVRVYARAYKHTYTQAYSSAIKKNEILPSAATWRTDLENFILSQRKTIMIPLTREI